MDKEQILSGGHLSNVVRIGNTVRRPTGPWTHSVHALLNHLEEKGFDHAPKVIGIDDQQREVLSYIPGETAGDPQPWPDWVWRDVTISATGRWLREYHNAASDFREADDSIWRMNWASQASDEIICHFDVAPYNVVLKPDGKVALIDWDVAAPGTPILEVAKVVNSFSPVHDVKTRDSLSFSKGVLNDAMLDCFVIGLV